MKCNIDLSLKSSVWKDVIAIGIAFLILFPSMAGAAPDQERLNRPPQLTQEPRSHDFKAERDKKEERLLDLRKYREGHKTSPTVSSTMKKTEFTDRAFLSAALAREEAALEMAWEVLRSPTKEGGQIELWASQVRNSAEAALRPLEKALHAEGGIDRKAYAKARQALEPHDGDSQNRSAPARFIMFLFPYCKQTMEAAIPALLRSPQEEVAKLACNLLIEQAQLGLEIRRWLHTHHYRNDI